MRERRYEKDVVGTWWRGEALVSTHMHIQEHPHTHPHKKCKLGKRGGHDVVFK